MPEAAGGAGGGDNKIVIELEIKVKEALDQLDRANKRIEALEGGRRKTRTRQKREHKEAIKESVEAHKAAVKLVKTYENASKESTRMQRAWSAIKKDVSQTGKDLKTLAKHDIGRGFLGGLMRGTGIAGLYQSVKGQPGGPGWRARLGGAVGRTAVGLGSRAVGWGLGAMQQAYQTYMQFGAAQFGMAGMGASRADRGMGRRAFGRGVGLGFTPTETAQMAPGVAAATGYLGATTTAQRFAMGGGYGPGRIGEAIGYMGTLTQAGEKWTGGRGAEQKTLQKSIALGMYSGLEKARLPEFYEGVRGLVQRQFSTAAGNVDAVNIARQLAVLGKAGGVGFQGQRGAQIMGQLDQMIKGPGGGEAGQAMILQAMGFGKPGGKTNYYEALSMQQEGIRDPENIKRVMKEVYSQRGVVEAGGADPRNREANLQFSLMSGLSLKQTEKLKDIYASNKTQEEQDKEAQKVIDESKSLQEQAVDASKDGFAAIKKHIAGVEAMQIRAGSKVAGPMMELQALQMKALVAISDWFPKIIEWLKKLWEMLKEIGMFIRELTFKGVAEGDKEATLKKMAIQFEKEKASIMGRTPTNLVEAYKQQADLAQAASVAAAGARAAASGRSSGLVGGALRFGMGALGLGGAVPLLEKEQQEAAAKPHEEAQRAAEQKAAALRSALRYLPESERVDPRNIQYAGDIRSAQTGGQIKSLVTAIQDNSEANKQAAEAAKKLVESNKEQQKYKGKSTNVPSDARRANKGDGTGGGEGVTSRSRR